jgi:hypothetical protein
MNSLDTPTIDLPFGVHSLSILLNGYGYLLLDDAVTTFTKTLGIISFAPSTIGPLGGAEITVTGDGFSTGITSISIGNIAVTEYTVISNTEIILITPDLSSATLGLNLIIVNSVATYTSNDVLDASSSGFSITSMLPVSASPSVKTDLVITGTGFGTDKT